MNRNITYPVLFNPYYNPIQAGAILSPISQMRKLRLSAFPRRQS